MGDRPAPERRRAVDGTWEIRVRDEWLADDPAGMTAWVEWQDGIARAARLLGSKPKPAPRQEPAVTADPERRKHAGGYQVRIDGKWIAESCVQAWEAYGRLRSITAVAHEMGTGSGNASNRIKRYEEVFGVTRPPALTSLVDDKSSGAAEPKRRSERRTTGPAQSDPVLPGNIDPDNGRTVERITGTMDAPTVVYQDEHEHQWGAWADLAHMVEACVVEGCEATRPWARPETLADPGADHASDMHPAPPSWRHDAKADSLLVISIDASIPVADLVTWGADRRSQLLWALELLHDALGEVGSGAR